jgi:hypothetical protein
MDRVLVHRVCTRSVSLHTAYIYVVSYVPSCMGIQGYMPSIQGTGYTLYVAWYCVCALTIALTMHRSIDRSVDARVIAPLTACVHRVLTLYTLHCMHAYTVCTYT